MLALTCGCESIDLVVGCCGLCHELRPCGGWMWRAFFFFSPLLLFVVAVDLVGGGDGGWM